jgi:hypothetical protein
MEERVAAERCICSALALYWGVTVERTTAGRYEESAGAQQRVGAAGGGTRAKTRAACRLWRRAESELRNANAKISWCDMLLLW